MSDFSENSPAGNKESNMQQQSQQQPCRPGSANKAAADHSLTQKEREERIKQLKEKQNEERQRKLEELKAQALATQKFREQKDEERRRRIDELKVRDNEKRQQVDERKKAIWEAEKERREYILRKNQERDQRLDAKRKNERSQIAFAFGSSTPRMLDSESGSIWAHRSISPLTRRSSERELGDGSAKKRAISASGLDRQTEDDSCESYRNFNVCRRKTDLMPTIPSPRDHMSRSSLGIHTPRTPGLRSGEITPKSLSTSRPGSAMSTSTTNSGLVTKRSTPQRKSRPVSIAVTGVSRDEKPPTPLSANKPIKRTPSASSARTTSSASETPKNRPSSAKVTPGATPKSSNTPALLSPSSECPPKPLQQQLSSAVTITKSVAEESTKNEKTIINNVIKAEQKHTEELMNGDNQQQQHQVDSSIESKEVALDIIETVVNTTIDAPSITPAAMIVIAEPEQKVPQAQSVPQKEVPEIQSAPEPIENPDMTASMIAKSRITTEEEAKAAIAERRRLAREEAERKAEIERKRLEAEEEAERQRLIEEEERQRNFEQETIRLAEEQKKLEDERLQQAIEENQKREEAEKQQKEEEARQKIEREQAERKAREEAEKLKIETAERLRKEEKEREERRKRVEAIMARTRKGGATNTPSKNDAEAAGDLSKSQMESMSQSMIEQTLNSTEQSNTNNINQQTEVKEIDYDQSVTEKENLLMSSFNKMNLNGNGLNNNLLETNNNLNLLSNGTVQQNGKTDATDLIIDPTTNGHDKNSIENAFKSTDASSDVPQKPQDAPVNQLIDFGSDATMMSNNEASTNLNNNFIDSNNSSLITHNINLNNNNNNNNNLSMLVGAASENNDDRDLSLL